MRFFSIFLITSAVSVSAFAEITKKEIRTRLNSNYHHPASPVEIENAVLSATARFYDLNRTASKLARLEGARVLALQAKQARVRLTEADLEYGAATSDYRPNPDDVAHAKRGLYFSATDLAIRFWLAYLNSHQFQRPYLAGLVARVLNAFRPSRVSERFGHAIPARSNMGLEFHVATFDSEVWHQFVDELHGTLLYDEGLREVNDLESFRRIVPEILLNSVEYEDCATALERVTPKAFHVTRDRSRGFGWRRHYENQQR